MKCDSCGKDVAIGEWPWCPHGKPHGQLSDFRERWDECIAPPPNEDFKPNVPLPDYDPKRGWRISTKAEERRMMRLNRVDFRN